MEPHVWPLFEGALTADDLLPFTPLNYGVLAHAFDLGLIDQQTLVDGFRTPGFAVTPPSSLLETFLRTSSYLDRKRDIQEELKQLARSDDDRRPELWLILSRLVLSRYSDDDQALRVLQEIYQELGVPTEMVPYTLYGGPGTIEAPKSSRSLVERLDSYLKQRNC